MRGCLLLIFGMVLGAIIFALAAVFLYGPAPAPLAPTSSYDLRVLLATGYLDREIQADAAHSSVGQSFQGIAVQSGSEGVVVSGTASRGGLRAPVRIVVRPVAQGNRIVLQVVRADLGGLPLPTALFRSVEDSMNRQLAQMLGNGAYHIVGVSTSPEGVTVDLSVS